MSTQIRFTRPVLVVAAASTLVAGAVSVATPGVASPVRRTLAGSHASWANPRADRGAVAASAPVSLRIYLASRNPAGLRAYATAASSLSGPSAGRFLTPAQARARFGPSAAEVAAVRTWAAGAGLRVVAQTPEYLQVRGAASAVGSAFHTSLHRFATAHGVLRGTTGAASLPSSVASSVLSVGGLSQSVRVNRPTYIKATPSDTKIPIGPNLTCSAYYGADTATGIPAGYTRKEPYSQCNLVPSQLRKAYGVTKSGLTGKHATIAIVDAYASSTMLADANQYSTNHGDAAFRAGQYTEYVTSADWNSEAECGGPAGWAPEESLDVEMAHGLAPDANVVYVGANSCNDADFLAAFAEIIDNHLADVVSNSWGAIMHSSAYGDTDPGLIAEYEQMFQMGAVEGIGFQFSSGDCADDDPAIAVIGANCDPTSDTAQTEFPTSDPWVTSVGATALGLANQAGAYGFETTMGDDRSVLSPDASAWTPFPGAFYFGGGGGTSADFAQPSYQRGVVPRTIAHHLVTGQYSATAQRSVPDVAMSGDLVLPTAVGISDGAPYSEAGYGGTSVAAPSFAAIIADAIQARGGRPVGFANPALYARDGAYNDVTPDRTVLSDVVNLPANPDGSLRIRLYKIGADYGLPAARGYDTATGLGSPTAQLLRSFG